MILVTAFICTIISFSSFCMEIPHSVGFDCPWGKQYFSNTPKETIIKDLLSLAETIGEDKNYTILHLAATAVEMPDLVDELIKRKPSLADLQKRSLGESFTHSLTPVEVHASSQKLAAESKKRKEPSVVGTPAPHKRFTLDQLKRLAAPDDAPLAVDLIDTAAPTPIPVLHHMQTMHTHPNGGSTATKPELTEQERQVILHTLGISTGEHTEFKATGLHMAARILNYPELTGLLLKNYPQQAHFLNRRDCYGLTPLATKPGCYRCLACSRGRPV